jgi:hypothetical protein
MAQWRIPQAEVGNGMKFSINAESKLPPHQEACDNSSPSAGGKREMIN